MSSTMVAGFKFRNKVTRHMGLWKQHRASNAAIQAVKLAEQSAEKRHPGTSGAKALTETKLYRSVENAAPTQNHFQKTVKPVLILWHLRRGFNSLRKKWLLSRERTPAAEADTDVAGLMARLNVVPFPVWSLTGGFPQPVQAASFP